MKQNDAKDSRPQRRKVRMVHSTYQPTKAQLEEEMDFSHLHGSTPEEMAQAVMRPVDITLVEKPEK